MKMGIAVCKDDPAGMQIKNWLISKGKFSKSPHTYDDEPLYVLKGTNLSLYTLSPSYTNREVEGLTEDYLVFATRHQAVSGVPSFCVHTAGNWGKSGHGGKDETLCVSAPLGVRKLFLALHTYAKETTHHITLESTHHGPALDIPSTFIEIGSNEEEWKKETNAEIIGKTLLSVLPTFELVSQEKITVALGIGGTHYCSNFNKIVERLPYTFAHICPKHQLSLLTPLLLEQAFAKSNIRPTKVVLDWKGLGLYKERVIRLLEQQKILYERTDKLLK